MNRTPRLLRAALAFVCLLGFGLAGAQTTTITASHLKMSGYAITTGEVLITPVNAIGSPIPFADGTGAQNGPTAFACQVVSGAITGALTETGTVSGTCSVPDATMTTPANILYVFQVIDQSNGLRTSGLAYTLQQVVGVSGATWALDHYGPPASTTNIQAIQATQGPTTPNSCVGPAVFTNTTTDAFSTCVGSVYINVASTGGVQIGGDIGGSNSSPTVTGIQGKPVSTTAPTSGQGLVWNGSQYAPATSSGGMTALTGDVAASGSGSVGALVTAVHFPGGAEWVGAGGKAVFSTNVNTNNLPNTQFLDSNGYVFLQSIKQAAGSSLLSQYNTLDDGVEGNATFVGSLTLSALKSAALVGTDTNGVERAATASQVNTLLATLSGCNTAGNVYLPQSATCVAQSGGSGTTTDTRPQSVATVMEANVAPSSSCVLWVSSNSPATQTLSACQSGTPSGTGTLTNLHITLGNFGGDGLNIEQNSTITIACNGQSYSIPMGLFFVAQDNPKPSVNAPDWIADMLGSTLQFSGNHELEANYASGCSVTFNNASTTESVTIFSDVTSRIGAWTSIPSHNYWHAYVMPLTNLPAYSNFQILPQVTDVNGGALGETTAWITNSTNGGSLEGYATVTADSNVVLRSGGIEDFFGSGYYASNAVGGHVSPKWASWYGGGIAGQFGGTSTLQNAAASYDFLAYRSFVSNPLDNVFFNNTLSIYFPNGESAKPGAPNPGSGVSAKSVTEFWTRDPMVAPVTFSPAAGYFASSTTVTLSNATSGATLCYTTDGSYPVANGAGTCTSGTSGATGASLSVTPPETLIAIASKSGFADAIPVVATYTNVAPPTMSVGPSCVNGTGTTSTLACSFTATAGDAAVVFIGNTSFVTPVTISSIVDSGGTTPVLIGGTTTGQGMHAYSLANLSAGSHTITVTLSAATTSQYPSLFVVDVKGASSTSPIDTSVFNAQTTATTSITTGSLTTAGTGEILIGYASANGVGTSLTAGAPAFSLITGTFVGSTEGGSYVATTAGSYAFTFTSGASDPWTSGLVALH